MKFEQPAGDIPEIFNSDIETSDLLKIPENNLYTENSNTKNIAVVVCGMGSAYMANLTKILLELEKTYGHTLTVINKNEYEHLESAERHKPTILLYEKDLHPQNSIEPNFPIVIYDDIMLKRDSKNLVDNLKIFERDDFYHLRNDIRPVDSTKRLDTERLIKEILLEVKKPAQEYGHYQKFNNTHKQQREQMRFDRKSKKR